MKFNIACTSLVTVPSHTHTHTQARGGHSEAARYLLAKGADVTAVDENGDSALSVAKTPSLVKLLKGIFILQVLHPKDALKSPLFLG